MIRAARIGLTGLAFLQFSHCEPISSLISGKNDPYGGVICGDMDSLPKDPEVRDLLLLIQSIALCIELCGHRKDDVLTIVTVAGV